MKALILYDYPPSPGGLATQGDLLYRGLREIGVDAYPANFEYGHEKEWYYRWLKPDVVIGIGYWGHTPDIVHHPQEFGMLAVPWLVADGYVANYRETLEKLPLVLATSSWVREVYHRDGIKNSNIQVLPVGCDTEAFAPCDRGDPRVRSVRESLGVTEDELMILTIGGDAASKGAQEVMQALAQIDGSVPDWKYVCKVWPQPRSEEQNRHDMELAEQLGIADRVIYVSSRASRNFIPYLLNACDIYAAPSRLEGFGMPQVEAGACGKPVVSIDAMALKDTLVHGETALLANVACEVRIHEAILGEESGYADGHRLVFDQPRVADYRASIYDLAEHLRTLMNDQPMRERMGEAARRRVVERFDYRVVAEQCVSLLGEHLDIDTGLTPEKAPSPTPHAQAAP
jgi:glycosyltransferase involved in cell wall biosynthesis